MFTSQQSSDSNDFFLIHIFVQGCIIVTAVGGQTMGDFVSDQLILGGIVNPPFLFGCAIHNISFCPRPGIEFEFVRTISQMLNFTFDVVETELSINSTNGSTAQLISNLENGYVNMSMSFLTVTAGRNLEFSQPIMYYRKAFLIRTPSSQKIEFLLTLPFGSYFWLSLVLMVPIFFISLTVMSRALHEPGKSSSLSHNAWTIIGSTVKPVIGSRTKPHAGNRCLLLTWQLAKTIILSLYSASLVGFLFLKRDPTLPFNGLSELVNALELKTFRTIQVRGEVSIAQSAINKSIRNRIEKALQEVPPLVFENTRSAVQYVSKTPGTVFGGFNTNLKIWSQIYNVCHVTIIEDQDVDVHLMALGFSKSFSYAEQIKRITSEVANSVYMSRLEKKYVSGNRGFRCDVTGEWDENGSKKLLPLSILQMQGSFWILVGGAVFGSAAVLFELLRGRKFSTKKRWLSPV